MLAWKLWRWNWTILLIVIADGQTPRCCGREITSLLSAWAVRIPAIVVGNPLHPFLETAVNFVLSPPPSWCYYTASVCPLKAESCLSAVLLVSLSCSKLLFQVEMGWNTFKLKAAFSKLQICKFAAYINICLQNFLLLFMATLIALIAQMLMGITFWCSHHFYTNWWTCHSHHKLGLRQMLEKTLLVLLK